MWKRPWPTSLPRPWLSKALIGPVEGAELSAGNPRQAVIWEDPTSFTEPYDRALAEIKSAWREASATVNGAEARTNAALRDLKDLKAFVDEVANRLEAASFQELPRVTDRNEPIDGSYALTVGPWRGVFLVSQDGTKVVALAFSKEPHEFEPRLGEIVANYHKEKGI